ncbi:hypothetical protein [Pontimicrobium sp. IMCC45349]|uniref:hypothetical protein n=1 Tax=Pontimicrobium sp. IMCC45349 TaxID=3391574 RepID=UPI00399FFDB1
MKLKLTFILLFVSLGIYAQKQIQPYSYTLRDSKNENPQTIFIYANAEAVNKVTFTLKNTKNEAYKDKDGNDITFEVFPFGEVTFRVKFIEAINNIEITLIDSEEEKQVVEGFQTFTNDFSNKSDSNKAESIKEKNQKRGNAINNFRNVYQFFNALIITAFQYDTEPVAGILKYNDEVTVIKKSIEGIDTEDYFKRQAKLLQKIIINNANSDNIILKQENGKYKNIDLDCFISFLNNKKDEIYKFNCDNDTISDFEKNSYIDDFFDFHQNSKKRKGHNAQVILKNYLKKRLKELYNEYELSKFLNLKEKDSSITFVEEYLNLKRLKTSCEKEKEDTKNLEDVLKNEIISLTSQLENENKNVKEVIKVIDFYWEGDEDLTNLNLIDEEEEKEFKKNLLSKRDSLKQVIDTIKKNITLSKKNVTKINDSIIPSINKNLIKKQNEINFLIAKYRDNLVRLPLWNLKIENIEIDLNDGFIEHIVVVGKIHKPYIDKVSIVNSIDYKTRGEYADLNVQKILEDFYSEPFVKEIYKNLINVDLKFENEFPIGFSSKTDFADLDNYNLYAFEGSEKAFSLALTDVIDLYIQRHQNDRLNFSPKDQVIRLPLDDLDENKEVELKKETSSKILNANIFTDFNGFKESEPNGLVQVEIEKQIPIWTKRMDLGLGRSSNFGLFNYANFNLTWAKVNEEDREAQVKYAEEFINNEPQIDKYITYLDIIRHENISTGVDLNLASFDFPLLKTRLELNVGGHYGRLKIVDKVTNEDNNSTTEILKENVNIIRLYPDAILRIRPDERFGGYLRYRPFKLIVPNNEEFYAVSSAKDFEENRELTKDWLQRYELGAFFTPSVSSDNKFFFRYRYTNTSSWETNGYSEVQVGYLMYLKL